MHYNCKAQHIVKKNTFVFVKNNVKIDLRPQMGASCPTKEQAPPTEKKAPESYVIIHKLSCRNEEGPMHVVAAE